MTNRFYPNSLFIFLIIWSLSAIGCLSGKSEKAVKMTTAQTEPAAPPTLADLHLSLAKPAYAVNEAIPVALTIQVGKFDLLVPYATVEGKGAFTKLVVKNAKGLVVPPKYPITFADKPKILIREGAEVRCIQGADLKAGTEKKSLLDDLQTHYKLEPGTCTLQVMMELKVYRESLGDQSQEVLELEREVVAIQKDTKLPADAKQEAIANLRKDIEFIKSNAKEESNGIYLPVDSLRGSKELASNVVTLKIQ